MDVYKKQNKRMSLPREWC